VTLNLSLLLPLWGRADFIPRLTHILENLSETDSLAVLPLQQGLTQSSMALTKNIKIILVKCQEAPETYTTTGHIFYYGVVAGCNCADDPSPIEPIPEYCAFSLSINKQNGDSQISLIDYL